MLKFRKKISKCVSFGLIAVLLCSALCSVSYASTFPSGVSEFSALLTSTGTGGVSDVIDFCSEHFEEFPFIMVFVDSWDSRNVLVYGFADDVFYNSATDSLTCEGVNYYCLWLNTNGIDYIQTGIFYSQSLYNHSYYYGYHNFDMLLVGGGEYQYNLDTEVLAPDTRILTVTRQSLYDSDYLVVTLNYDIVGVTSLFTVSYSDERGSYTYGYQPFEFLDMSGYSDVSTHETYTTFKVNISSIPTTGAFTLSGATLDTATLWGSKSVTFAYSYGGDGISLPSNYTDVTYFNNFYESDYSGSIGATFLGTLYFGVYDNGTAFYLRDSEDYLVQNFDVKFIALPNYLWATTGTDLRQWSLEEYYELFEMYDIVILGLGEEAFDELYGVGNYSAWSQLTVSQVINLIEKTTPEYKSCPLDLLESNLSDFDFSFYWSNIGFIVTRNYLLKRTFYALGDVDSRLLDFETKLLGESGTFTAIETKLITGLTQDNTFYNKVEDFMVGFTAFYNNLLVEDWFNKVSGYLSDIKDSLLNLSRPLRDLEEPFLSIYRLFTGALADVIDLLPDFQNYADKAVNPEVPCFPTPVPTVPLIPTLGGGYDVVPY